MSGQRKANETLVSFEEAARPLVEYLARNCNPHVTAVVTCTGAELLQGKCAFTTYDYVGD